MQGPQRRPLTQTAPADLPLLLQIFGTFVSSSVDYRGIPNFYEVYSGSNSTHAKPMCVPETSALYNENQAGQGASELSIKSTWWQQVSSGCAQGALGTMVAAGQVRAAAGGLSGSSEVCGRCAQGLLQGERLAAVRCAAGRGTSEMFSKTLMGTAGVVQGLPQLRGAALKARQARQPHRCPSSLNGGRRYD